MASRAELQRRLADGFDAKGWQYDTDIGARVIDAIAPTGHVVARTSSAAVPANTLARLGTTREEFTAMIEASIGGLTLDAVGQGATVSLTINDHRHSVTIGSGASVASTEINTGSVVNINGDSPSDDLLDAVATLVTAGLAGDWNVEAASELGDLIDARTEISFNDVQAIASNAAASAGADKASAQALMADIAKDAIGGVLATGIVAALGAIA